MPSTLVEIISGWFDSHPGGQFAFCHDFGVIERDGISGLTRDQARIQFKKALRQSKWSVIRGFHAFRHSYASNLAASGVDQRIIDKHMGHQTEEMRRRYQHLRPGVCKSAVEVLVE
jgi:integrase